MAGKPRGLEEMISGLGLSLAFASLWVAFGWNFMVFPLVFGGLIPAIRGAIRYFSTRKLTQQQKLEIERAGSEAIERSILQTAKNESGRITPAVVALHSDISIQDANTALENMVKLGFASMDVSENGTVEYVFQEFVPKLE